MRLNRVSRVAIRLLLLLPTVSAAQTSTTSPEVGYVRMLPDEGNSSPAGVAIFGYRNNGVLITEAGVPASQLVQSGRIFVDVNGPVNTGIALANPNAVDAEISYYFTDTAGNSFGQGVFTLPADHQIARFMTEPPFNGSSSMEGTLTFTSSAPVSSIALRGLTNERGDYVLTTLPVSSLGRGFGGSSLVFPHFADGGGWTMQVVLINPGDTALSGTLQFTGQGSKNANPRPVRVQINGVTSSTFSYTIAPRSEIRLATQPAQTNIEIGSIQVTSTQPDYGPSGLAIFSFQNNGVTVSAASVPALPAGTAFRTYVESNGTIGQPGYIQTGVAISNATPSAITVSLDIDKLDGTPTGLSTTVDIPAGGQIAKFVNEVIPDLPATFMGVLRVSCPSPIYLTSRRMRYNERSDFLVTTVPARDDATAPSGAEVDFPHIVSGGGYSTQLIMLSPAIGINSSLKLWLLAQDGTALKSVSLQALP
jgi:hypothetical protein